MKRIKTITDWRILFPCMDTIRYKLFKFQPDLATAETPGFVVDNWVTLKAVLTT